MCAYELTLTGVARIFSGEGGALCPSKKLPTFLVAALKHKLKLLHY